MEAHQGDHALVLIELSVQHRFIHGALAFHRIVMLAQAGSRYLQSLAAGINTQEGASHGLGCLHGGAASAAQVCHPIPFHRQGKENPLQQLPRLLGSKAGALRILLLQVADVRPHIPGVDQIIIIVPIHFAAAADASVTAAVFIHVPAHVILSIILPGNPHLGNVEANIFPTGVEQNGIMLPAEALGGSAAAFVSPNDFVHEVFFAEDVIADHAAIRS